MKRESLRKAEEVVTAAEENPEKFGDLQTEMDRSGKVNTAHKKLTVRKARQAIETAPPPMPMNAKECGTWSIDFPWAAEMDREQASIDAADRAFRPYPEMSIKSVCKFATEQLVPNLPDVVSVWLWVPNYILVRGYHSHVIAALGFKPDHASTLLTWDKVELGRGQLLREQTEHAILLRRGQPLVDVFGEDPPTTLIREARRENSRKPDAFYRLAERVTPATRYAAIFSRGGEGGLWDGLWDRARRPGRQVCARRLTRSCARRPRPRSDRKAGEAQTA
jgi:N6-adenosine-specific RNA methylase IME4